MDTPLVSSIGSVLESKEIVNYLITWVIVRKQVAENWDNSTALGKLSVESCVPEVVQ